MQSRAPPSITHAPFSTPAPCVIHRGVSRSVPQCREVLVIFLPRLKPCPCHTRVRGSHLMGGKPTGTGRDRSSVCEGQLPREGFSLLRGRLCRERGTGRPAHGAEHPLLSHTVRGQFVERRGLGDLQSHGMSCSHRLSWGSGRESHGGNVTPQASARRPTSSHRPTAFRAAFVFSPRPGPKSRKTEPPSVCALAQWSTRDAPAL